MSRAIILAALFFASHIATCAAGDAHQQAGLVARGQALVEEKCARCHAIGSDDESPHAKAPPFRVIVERYPSEDLAEALAEGIVSGHPEMPVFVFESDEIEAFLAYLDSLAPPF
ncbi:MAG: cytochrome c [Hyphomicrobiaceae bacterium]|nr:cytochrome c [Hyphomicrobiaceae bacterium]